MLQPKFQPKKPLFYENDALYSEHGKARLRKSYMRDDEKSIQERLWYVSAEFADDQDHAQRMYEYASNLWLSYATPILAYGRTEFSLPISCYLLQIEDSRKSLVRKSTESRVLSMAGGGIGLGMKIRPRDDEKSTGIMPHLKTYDADTMAWKQAATRRSAIAAYLDVNHPEIEEFIVVRDQFGGDVNRRSLNIHHGIVMNDDFMERVRRLATEDLTKEEQDELDEWELSHPMSKVRKTASVRSIWESIIETRLATGEPYMDFVDNVNRGMPLHQYELGLRHTQSNLCAEITQAVGKDYLGGTRTAICCLSSLNLGLYDEWKDDRIFVGDVVRFLDNVLSRFIEDAPKMAASLGIPEALDDAVYGATMERSMGIGALGWHDLLQSKGIPFESALATSLNHRIFKQIKEDALAATRKLAEERGACPDYKNWVKLMEAKVENGEMAQAEMDEKVKAWPPMRNSHLLSIAPNASSSIIMDTSPSIEPYSANIYREEGNAGIFTRRNKHLEKLLESKGKNTNEVWQEIINNDGSVRTLDFLSDYEKDVFKTFREIDQAWVVSLAADRQEYICQAQSLNLFFAPTANIGYMAFVHLDAWKAGVKTLYYCRSDTAKKVGSMNNRLEREAMEKYRTSLNNGESVCLACEG